jgi:hypothetical protein
MVEHGRANEKVHIVMVEQDEKERIKNDRKQTRFVLCCDTPEAFSELHAEWDRIVRKVGNKSIAISLVTRAWREGLSDPALDRLLAALDAVEHT